jgi:Contractile injection system tube protein
MPSLSKASLREYSDNPSTDKGLESTEFEVQFNPQSLKLQLDNKVEGGDTKGSQRRQYLGKASTTLSFDLHFDTADEGTTEKPVSVRTRTAMVERFVLPKGSGNSKQAPPKCLFHWDELTLTGVIDSISIDFELFAPNGTPLRAKMGVSIKEQDAKYELDKAGPGANNANSATPPGKPGNGPGTTSAAGPTDRSAPALGGESAADFAARMGLDPSAWRGIAAQIGGGASLSLAAGASISFSSSLSASVGIGVSAGVDFGASASVDASFGLSASAGFDASASGFALSAAGGVGAAIESVSIVKSASASASARRAFGNAVPASGGAGSSAAAPRAAAGLPSIGAASLPSASAAALAPAFDLPPPATNVKPALPDQPRAPLQLGGSAISTQVAAPAPPPPRADARAASFGYGVPLKPRVGSAADLRSDAASGRVALKPASTAADVLVAGDPSAPPWTRLPAGTAQTAADKTQARRSPRCGCGCK